MFLAHLLTHAIGRTKAGRFVYLSFMVLFVVALPLASVVGLSIFSWNEIAKEYGYHQRLGDGWQAQYEAQQGPLLTARAKAGGAVLLAVLNGFLGVVLYKILARTLGGALGGQISSAGGGWTPPAQRRRRRRLGTRDRT